MVLNQADHQIVVSATGAVTRASVCLQQPGVPVDRACECHPSCSHCGYSQAPTGEDDCVACSLGGPVWPLRPDLSGYCAEHDPRPSAAVEVLAAIGPPPQVQYTRGRGIWVTSDFVRDDALLAELRDPDAWLRCQRKEGVAGFGWWDGVGSPRNAWERVALHVWQGQRLAHGLAGLEYWCNVLQASHENGWHHDKDETRMARTGELAFPTLGAVWYGFPHGVGREGTPPLEGGVLELGRAEAGANSEAAALDADRIRPEYNRLVVFDPRRKHRVLPVVAGERFSFQVNLWHTAPMDRSQPVAASPPPQPPPSARPSSPPNTPPGSVPLGSSSQALPAPPSQPAPPPPPQYSPPPSAPAQSPPRSPPSPRGHRRGHRGGHGPSSGLHGHGATVRRLDAASLAELRGSAAAAFVKFDPPRCDACAPLDAMWSLVAQQWPGTAWQADCAADAATCTAAFAAPATGDDGAAGVGGARAHAHASWAALASSGQPVFAVWLGWGGGFDVFDGPRKPEALAHFLRMRGAAWADGEEDRVARATPPDDVAALIEGGVGGGIGGSGGGDGATRRSSHSSALRFRSIPVVESIVEGQLGRSRATAAQTMRRSHLAASVPAIVRGDVLEWPAMRWSAAEITARCGARAMGPRCSQNEVKVFDARGGGALWAGVRTIKTAALGITRVAELMRRQAAGHPLYVHDASVELFCPALLADLRAPRHFPVDWMQMPPAAIRHTSHSCASPTGVAASMHPSVFIGAKGTRSSLHADSAASRFMMALFAGKKRFRLFNASDARCLDASPLPPGDSYRGTYELDAFDDAALAAALAATSADERCAEVAVWEGDLAAGDLIFIPEEWPHAVLNIDDAIGISYNFVDEWSAGGFLAYHAARVVAQDPSLPRQPRRTHLEAISRQSISLAAQLEAEGWAFRGEEHRLSAQLVSALTLATFATLETAPPRAADVAAASAVDVPWGEFFRRSRLEHGAAAGASRGWDGARYGQRVREWLASEAFLALNGTQWDSMGRPSRSPSHRVE